MKKGVLVSSILGMTVLATSLYVGVDNNEEYYTPRAQVSNEDGANGAMNWLHSRRANQVTGEINPADVIAARDKVASMKFKTQTTLNWGELGPTNIGGRTRAILIDKDNSNILYSASVSGGLFKSTTGGSSWKPVNDFKENLAVVSICQAPNGDIYYGTGEGLYYSASGTGSQGILGGGIFKSTDGGNTFSVIPSTEPVPNSTGVDFASVGKLATDPVNSQRIYAATNNGLQVSDDGGTSWTAAFTNPVTAALAARDMVVTSSGKVWVKQGADVYKSDNGNPGTYNRITGASTFSGSSARIRIAVAPQDENYVYAVATSSTSTGAEFRDAWQSKDGGVTWTKVGQNTIQLNPHRDQGNYNHALAVDPMDKERIIVGGVELWEWSSSNGWLQIATLGFSPGSQLYVHADNHEIKFDPANPNIVYVGNDGGIFRSTNGGITWSWIVKNYVTTQFYNIAVGPDDIVMGGTQDNGTILLDPSNPFPKAGERTPGINVNGSTRDGDGGYAELSKLDPRIRFKAMQYGVIGRSVDGGETFSLVISNDVDPNNNVGARNFADFVTPFGLWEKLDEPLSQDSVTFKADSSFLSIGFGNGGKTYTGTVPRPQASAKFIPEGIVIREGNSVVRSDANGNLIGDGTGTFNSTTGDFSVTFNNSVNLEIIIKAAVRYDAGAAITVSSAINELPIDFTLPTNLEPLDSILIQDPVQSMFAVGVTAFTAAPGAIDRNEIGGVWITREALQNINQTPTWYHVATLGNNVRPTTLTFSPDGDALWVGTNTGVLYRLSNLNQARDSANTSINDYYIGGNVARSQTSVIQKTVVRNFFGRAITDVAIHPDNSDLVVVTLGNYGNSQYLYYSSNGTAPQPALSLVQSDLPQMPLYTATFNYKSGNPNEVYVGSDLGVFATDDITATTSIWRPENAGMANVPVFDLVQQRTVRYDLKNSSDFEGFTYAGTHGRGIFMTNSTSGNVVSTQEPEVVNEIENGMNIFPNPSKDHANVELQLTEGRTDVEISIRSITGKMVKRVSYKKLDAEVKDVKIDVSGLANGTYILSVQEGNKVRSGKLIVSR